MVGRERGKDTAPPSNAMPAPSATPPSINPAMAPSLPTPPSTIPPPTGSLAYNSPQRSPCWPLPLQRPEPRCPPPLIFDVLLYRVLPLLFFITLLITLTIIIGITFYLKRPLPPHFVLGTTIVLICLVFLGLIGWLWRYVQYQVPGRDTARDGYEWYRYLELERRLTGGVKQKPRIFNRLSPIFLTNPARIIAGRGHGPSESSRASGDTLLDAERGSGHGNRNNVHFGRDNDISRWRNQGAVDPASDERRVRNCVNRVRTARGRPDVPPEDPHTQREVVGTGLGARGGARPGPRDYHNHGTQPTARASMPPNNQPRVYEAYRPPRQPLQTLPPGREREQSYLPMASERFGYMAPENIPAPSPNSPLGRPVSHTVGLTQPTPPPPGQPPHRQRTYAQRARTTYLHQTSNSDWDTPPLPTQRTAPIIRQGTPALGPPSLIPLPLAVNGVSDGDGGVGTETPGGYGGEIGIRGPRGAYIAPLRIPTRN